MKELRIGLVLYGGVSLAVYINGILTELWHLLRASRARQNEGERGELNGTAEIYAQLLDDLKCPNTGDLRVVVDTISGSSAGGINGATLTKAIIDGGDATVFSKLWIEDADISKLRVEPAAKLPFWMLLILAYYSCKAGFLKTWISTYLWMPWKWFLDHIYSMICKSEDQSTPLKGEHFTRNLVLAFAKAGEGEKACGNEGISKDRALLPKRSNFDLYITQTDIYGWPRRLPVSEDLHRKSLYERTHAHVMHFQSKNCGDRLNDDFGLTYAARGTASFPLVFPSINYERISKAYRKEKLGASITKIEKFTHKHLREHDLSGLSANDVWMIDGGVLDNKPFSYVTQAIERKAAEHEVYRAIVYIEPNPKRGEKLEEVKSPPTPKRVVGNLLELFLYEPIYEDLKRLRDRNTKVKKIKKFLCAHRSQVLRSAMKIGNQCRCLRWPPYPADADRWKQATNSFATKSSLSGYPGYVVLKAHSSTCVLANVICRVLRYPRESCHAFFIRQLVHAWFERKDALSPPRYCSSTEGYILKQEQLSLLRNFDIYFRLRRLRALVHATNEKYPALKGGIFRRCHLDKFKSELEKMTAAFQMLEENDSKIKEIVLNSFDCQDIDSAIDSVAAEKNLKMDDFIEKHESILEQFFESLSKHFRCVNCKQKDKMAQALRVLPYDGHKGIRQHIMEAFVTFPFIDIIAFPLMDSAGVEDLIDVKVMRMSPFDVEGRKISPLKSRGLGSFKGFFSKSAREHDLKLGRLDGARRLVDLITKAVDCGQSNCTKDLQKISCSHLKKLIKVIEKGTQV